MEITTTTVQAGKFVLVGLFNTAFDFALFNIVRRVFKLSATKASYISTSVAMTLSFFLNKLYVFSAKGIEGTLEQAFYFFPATIFSVWVIGNGTIYILTKKWHWPLMIALKIYRVIPLLNRFSDDFLTANTAKVIGTGLSLISNFLLYSKVVFA